jgi:type IV secretion system protein VirB1
MIGLPALIQDCASGVHPVTMAAVVAVESGANPFAIGVVDGRLQRQPRSLPEALATAVALQRAGRNFSLGLAQINRHQLARHGLDLTSAFDPCSNLRAAARILTSCYAQARRTQSDPQQALQVALSCYYSGDATRGFRPDPGIGTSYVQRVLAMAARQAVARPPRAPDAAVTASGAPQ